MSQAAPNSLTSVSQQNKAAPDWRAVPARLLHGLRQSWQKVAALAQDESARLHFDQKLAAAYAQVQARAQRVPALQVDAALPISSCVDALIAAIRQHQVIVVAGETGSGKSTQLPKLALAAGCGTRGFIGCTQPRRIAAKSVAARVAEELTSPLGALVGYQVRFSEKVADSALIKFMTDGILLAETQSDRYLHAYDTLIIDEAHERSLNIDFLLGFIKKLLKQRQDLKVIITSATIDTARFSQHFNHAPVFNVEGRGYPVEVRYRPLSGDEEDRQDRSLIHGIIEAVRELDQQDPMADVLIFFPGEREIHDAKRSLEKAAFKATEVVALYARLSSAQQAMVFQPGPKRRLVLATNVAETSITVPRIKAVIDTGTARIARYSPRTKIERLHIEPISQASANQRAGRCGRIAPGVCFRLFDEADYQQRPAFTDPEILRSALAGVLLRMLRLNLGDPRLFPFLDPPDERSINDGFLVLRELGALSRENTLSEVGRAMSELPIDVHYARMIVEAKARGLIEVTLVLTAALSIQDPRERPLEAREAAQLAHAAFADEQSDFLSLLRLWDAYLFQRNTLSQSQLRQWAKQSFLSFSRLREWHDLYNQLKQSVRELNWIDADATASSGAILPQHTQFSQHDQAQTQSGKNKQAITAAYANLHQVLLSALLTQVGQHEEKGLYRGTRSRSFQLFPGSSVKSNPRWIMADSLLDTHKVWAITAARIEPQWLESMGQHLIKKRHYDAHWDQRSGVARVYEDQSLLGLLIVRKRAVLLEPVEAKEARALFLLHALALGEVDAPHRLFAHNAKTRAEAHDKEDKLRTRGLLKSGSEIAAWFAARVPHNICSVPALTTWLKTPAGKLKEPELRLSVMDLLLSEQPKLRQFPDELLQGGQRLPLLYHFDPSAENDGATLQVKLEQLGALSPAELSWLVPGLLEEKLIALIKSLPKSLRRLVVPAPDFARAFLQSEPLRTGWLEDALAQFFSKIAGAAFAASDFDLSELPRHLTLRIEVLGPASEVLAASREVLTLQQAFKARAAAAFTLKVGALYNRTGLTSWPFDLPPQVLGEDGSAAYPALVDEAATSVGLRAFATLPQAQAAHAKGALRLLRLHLPDELRYWRKHLLFSNAAVLAYAAVDSSETLRADVVEASLLDVASEAAGSCRSAADFQQLAERVRSQLGARLQLRAQLIEQILLDYSAMKRRLVQPIIGFAKANLDDVQLQLDGLVFKHFAAQVDMQQLTQYPRYFKALGLRLDRLFHDPIKDQSKLLDVLPFLQALRRLERAQNSRFRWLLEEFRVAVFAPEVKTAEPVSAKKLLQLLEKA